MLDLTRRTYAWTGTRNASPSVQRDNGSVVRTNLTIDPRALSLTLPNGVFGWEPRWFGNGGDGINSVISGATDGPLPEITSYARKTWTQIGVGLQDIAWTHTKGGTLAFPVTPGMPCAVSTYLRASKTQPAKDGSTGMVLQWRNSNGDYIGSEFGPMTEVITAGKWQRYAASGIAPAGAAYVSVYTQVFLTPGNLNWAVGDTLDGTGLLVERASTIGSFFDGGTAPTVQIGADVLPLASRLTTATGESVPLMMTEYAVARAAQHTVHEIIGRSDPDVTFGPTQTRAGSATFLYETLDRATAARELLAAPGAVTLTQTDMPSLGMQFVVTGELAMAPDQQDPDLWTLTVPFREVIA